ncbi:hypothetical protein [Pantoea stewartii]|nr:hypothetical protein [Pantoea stewartii]
MRKERQRSFAVEAKEPVIDRISRLAMRYSSRSAAARAWGININTLNSYFKNDAEPPMPRDNLLTRIASCEGVSLEWLKYGEGESPVEKPKTRTGDLLSQMLDFLSPDERQQLAVTLGRKGIETVLYLLDENNIRLMQLDNVVKEKILGIQPRTPEEAARADDKARECGADNSKQTPADSLASEKRQAG